MDTRVLVGGRLAPIPESVVAQMAVEGLAPTDKIRFTPMQNFQKPAGWSSVTGHLDTLGLPAIIYHMTTAGAESAFDSRWMVRPLGLKYLGDGKGPLVICKLLGTIPMPEHLGRAAASLPEEPQSSKCEIMCAGPGDVHIPLDEWVEKTADGCHECGTPLPSDESVEWFYEPAISTWLPMCLECYDEDMDDAMSNYGMEA